MRFQPIIHRQTAISGVWALPPPVPLPPPSESGSVPPVIDSQTNNMGSKPLPPPLPAELLRKEFVSGDLSSAVAALEEERRNASRRTLSGWIWLAMCLLLLLATLSWVGYTGTLVGPVEFRRDAVLAGITALSPFSILSLVLACRSFSQANTARWSYRACYKEKVFTAAIRLLNPAFRYQPDAGISRKRFLESRMFRHRIERYYSEDHVQGMQGATSFEFAEVRCGYEKNPLFTPKDEPTYVPVFQGLYFIADFNKHFVTRVLVLPRGAEQPEIGELLGKGGGKRGKIIHLEDPEFEREFAVYAEDELEVRYLLTPAFMRRILDLRRVRGGQVWLSFREGNLHLALEGYQDLFEPDLGSSAYSLAQVQVFLNQVSGVLSLIEMLNLNTRIWSKR